MADVKKSVEFTLRAKTAPLEASLKKIPEVTDKEAKKMVRKLDKAFDKVEKSAKKTASSTKKSFKSMTSGIGAAGGAMAAVGAATIAAGAALFEFNRQISNSVNELNDLSATTGISTENLHGLRIAAKGSGLEFGVMEAGLRKLPSSMQAAAKGTGAAAEAFDRLGVDATNADGSLRDANEVFEDSIKALASIESEAERAALAADLFGMKAGAALIQSGAIAGMEHFNALVQEFGVNVGPKASEEAAKFQRNLATLEEVSMGTGQQLLSAFGGGDGGVSLSSLINELSRGIVYFGSLTEDVGTVVSMMFQEMMTPVLAMGFALEGKTSQAMRMMADATKAESEAIFSLGDSFDKANEKLKRFDELSTKASKSAGAGGGGGGGRSPAVVAAEAQTEELQKQNELKQLQNQLDQIRNTAISDTLSEEQKIRDTYEQELQRLNEIAEQSEGQLSIETERLEIKARMERDLHDLRLEQQQEIDEQKEKDHQDELKRIEKETKERISNLKTIGGAITGFASDYVTATKTLMENTGTITEEGALRLFRLQKAAGLADVAINTSAAIMKALAVLGPIAGGIAAGAIGSLGAVQAAAIASEQPPSFDMGGMVGQAGSFAPDEVGAQLLTGEAVLDRSTVRRIGGERGVRSLQRGGGSGGVTVISPYKHFDRFITSSMGRNSRLRRMTSSRQKRGY